MAIIYISNLMYALYKEMKGMIFIDLQPKNFNLEKTTIWSFPDRGKWATHSGEYRGNWSPYIPRNLILRYSNPEDWILDQFLGSGTTLVEAKLLFRNAIGVDVNDMSIQLSNLNLNFQVENGSKIVTRQGDARNLKFIKDESIDLICTHPPYADIINYSKGIDGDLSLLKHNEFLLAMEDVAKEAYRVLKQGKICVFMIGDMRKYGNVIPLGMETMNIFLNTGFKSKEIIIKEQHNCGSTNYWVNKQNKFLMLAHEYIFVLVK